MNKFYDDTKKMPIDKFLEFQNCIFLDQYAGLGFNGVVQKLVKISNHAKFNENNYIAAECKNLIQTFFNTNNCIMPQKEALSCLIIEGSVNDYTIEELEEAYTDLKKKYIHNLKLSFQDYLE